MSTNDNESGAADRAPPPSQAHGQAALILVESLIHGLITKSVLTTKDSLDIVTAAADVQADYAAEAVDGLAHEMRQSQGLLSTIADSLRMDIPVPPARPTRPTLVEADDPPPLSQRPIDPPHLVDGIDE